MENNLSFPSSPNDFKRLDMSPAPNSVSPNRSGGYMSDSNDLNSTTIVMPPALDDTTNEMDSIGLLANPKMQNSLSNSPVGSPKQDISSFNVNNNNENYNFPQDNSDDIEEEENTDFVNDYYPTQPNPGMTPEEMLNRKQEILFQFDKLERRGLTLPRKYTLRDDLDFLEFEYEKIKKQRETENSIQFSRKMLMACITGVEYLNGKFDPFDVNLEGWSESVMENISDYDEVFEELHDKYKSKVKVAPEIRLMLMLGGSAFMFHLSNTLLKPAATQMGDMFKNNPDLMKGMANMMMGNMMQGNNAPSMPPMMMPPNMMPSGMMPPGMMQQPPAPQIVEQNNIEQSPPPQMNEPEEVRKVNLNNNRPEMKGPASLDALLGTQSNDPDSLASINRKRVNRSGRKSRTNEISIS